MIKPWEEYTVGDIRRGVREIDRATCAVEIAQLYTGRAHWLITCPPSSVAHFGESLPAALCEHAIWYADGGVATLMKIDIPLGGLMLAGALHSGPPVTLVVAIPKEHCTQEAIERFFGEKVPAAAERTDVILLRDEEDKVPWPTVFLDAVMLADPHLGQQILDSGNST